MLAFATEDRYQLLERLRPTACYVDQLPWYRPSTDFIVRRQPHQPMPRQVRAIRVDDGVFTGTRVQAIAEADLLESGSAFARRQRQRDGSVLLVAFKRDRSRRKSTISSTTPGGG